MLADYHVHSYFSEDTDCPMERSAKISSMETRWM